VSASLEESQQAFIAMKFTSEDIQVQAGLFSEVDQFRLAFLGEP
jgi:hypothetical protein